MQYKTIVLELIQQRPALYEQLKSSNTLLSTVNRLATLFRERHLDAIEQLRQVRPDSAPAQLTSEAMEIALEMLQEQLPPDPEAAIFGQDVVGRKAEVASVRSAEEGSLVSLDQRGGNRSSTKPIWLNL